MTFKIEIETDNAAFEGTEGIEAEVPRILRHVAKLVEAGVRTGSIHDSNGNKVGTFDLVTLG